MTNEEILEKQVEALEKLIQLKQAVIEEQEAKINKLEAERYAYPGGGVWQPSVHVPYVQPYQPWIGGGGGAGGAGIPGVQIGGGFQGGAGGSSGSVIISTNTCPDGTPHQYPSAHTGIPSCAKCGAYQGSITTATFTNGNNQVDLNGNQIHTSGYCSTLEATDINHPNNRFVSLTGGIGKR